MKNIFLKETDKPSYLVIDTIEDRLYYQPILHKKTVNVLPHFIYITNNEEIKEGWKGYAYKEDVKGKVFKHSYTYNQWYKDAKQIVLTNDPTLIADGVQEVNSSFLSFYAENPVYYVRVEKWLDDEGERFYSLDFPPKKEKDIIMELQKDPLLKEFDDKVNENLSALKNKKETEEYSDIQKKVLEDNKEFVKRTDNTKLDILMSEFENLEGITSNMFDEKDWARFDRFVENREKEEKCKGSFKDCFKTLNECTCDNIIDNWLEKNGNPEISKQVEREAELYQTINKIIDGGKNLPKGFEVSRGQAIDYAFDVALEVAEKMYSEEEVIALIHRFNYDLVNSNIETFKEWFDEHKKQ